MSLSNRFGNLTCAVTLITVALSASSRESLQFIEPEEIDPTQPVNACVRSTPNDHMLTAAKKLNEILARQSQMIAGSGNKLGVNGKGGKEEVLYSIAKNLSGKGGYIISSSHPKEQHDDATGFCLSSLYRAIAINPIDYGTVPVPVNKGKLGLALKNQGKAESFTAVIGKHGNGAIFAVHFNKTGAGSLIISNATGTDPVHAEIYADFKLSEEIQNIFVAKTASSDPTPQKSDVNK